MFFKRLHNPDKINDLFSGPFKIIAISNDHNVVTIEEDNKISRQNIKNITSFRPKRGEDVVLRHADAIGLSDTHNQAGNSSMINSVGKMINEVSNSTSPKIDQKGI